MLIEFIVSAKATALLPELNLATFPMKGNVRNEFFVNLRRGN